MAKILQALTGTPCELKHHDLMLNKDIWGFLKQNFQQGHILFSSNGNEKDIPSFDTKNSQIFQVLSVIEFNSDKG